MLWYRKWHPISVFLLGKFHGQAIVHGAKKSQTWLSNWVHAFIYIYVCVCVCVCVCVYTHTHKYTYTHTHLVQRLAPPGSTKHTFPSPCICVEIIYLAKQSHPLVLGPKIQKQTNKKNRRTSLEVQWLRFCASTTRAQVPYLVRELRSYMPCI